MVKKRQNNIEYQILECIRDNPGGLTITDIANLKKFSRNTVSKYVLNLELKNLIFKKKVGAYNLYFSTKKSYFPKATIMSYYKALLKGFKNKFPNKEQIIKEIGREMANDMEFAIGPTILKQLESLSGHRILKYHLEALRNFYPSYDIFQTKIEISELEFDPNVNKAVYRFKNSNFLKKTEDFTYHIYLVCGAMESILNRRLKIPVECDVIEINVSDNKKDTYFDISIQIKD